MKNIEVSVKNQDMPNTTRPSKITKEDFRQLVTAQLTIREYQELLLYVNTHQTNISSAVRTGTLALLETAAAGKSQLTQDLQPTPEADEIRKLKFKIELIETFLKKIEVQLPSDEELKKLYTEGYKKPLLFGLVTCLIEPKKLPEWLKS